ncbi:MAG: type I restriction endonuclease subunit R, partial [Spirochaetota bacterium]
MTFNEDHISQIPALIFLQKLGYTYLTQEEALSRRDNKVSNVILEDILMQQLQFINEYTYKGRRQKFTEGALTSAIQTLKTYRDDGLIRTNEQVYDLLCLGKSFEQTVDGDTKSFTVKYIDWENPQNNVYHVTEEFTVERTGSYETYRPDIVLFVNGIPLSVIECKKPEEKDSLAQAISQHIRNQRADGITRLFVYSQLLLAINKNEAKYATTNTPLKFWSVWKEDGKDNEIIEVLKKENTKEETEKLFNERFRYVVKEFQAQWEYGTRIVTEQDRALYALCRPERLLDFTYKYIVFDGAEKKIARYQQYSAIQKTIKRVINIEQDGKRSGGVIWHTQGSGKSLTMVMLAKAIILEPSIKNAKVIVVTDREDLDKQIADTFVACGKEAIRATTGRNLADLITENKETIITTLVHKFQAILKTGKVADPSPNIFVLVDEGHRTQYGSFHVAMNRVFPNACYIGFTGTPLMKNEKNTAAKFGGIIDVYNITQAVNDQAVVPLLYEGRYVELEVHEKAIDAWWERICKDLTKEQQADLKRKFAKADQLNKADKKIQRIAYDISEHYKKHWQGTGFKAQIAADSKVSAIKYKKYLDEFGIVSCDVIISAPDQREGYTETDEDTTNEVLLFWKKMMEKYKTEEEYNRQIIGKFKSPDEPEIIIVVDKLLTGFDAPRNTVLYIARSLKEHTLLQAIARVNRLFDGKDYGYIVDYYG